MGGGPGSGLERLWRRAELDRRPRLGLSLERIVESGVELADREGLGAVSMKRVAEGLGFTTMALYRHVTGKDELLLLMHDAAWQPPAGFETAADDWRVGLAQWTRGQHEVMQRHPWLEQVRFIERAGTPSQIAWMELGLRALTGVPLSDYEKVALLLLLAGFVSSQARLAGTVAEGAREGLFEPDQAHATEAFAELLRSVLDPARYPALLRAVEGGAFAPVEGPTYLTFDLGLEVLLDGIERRIARSASA